MVSSSPTRWISFSLQPRRRCNSQAICSAQKDLPEAAGRASYARLCRLRVADRQCDFRASPNTCASPVAARQRTSNPLQPDHLRRRCSIQKSKGKINKEPKKAGIETRQIDSLHRAPRLQTFDCRVVIVNQARSRRGMPLIPQFHSWIPTFLIKPVFDFSSIYQL